MSETPVQLLSTDALLASVVSREKRMRVELFEQMQEIAELERRGAGPELGYKDVAYVLQHAIRCDRNTARQMVANSALLSSTITPTGSELAPELPLTAEAAAEGALSIAHVAEIAKAMKHLPAEVENLVVDVARENEPLAVRDFGKGLAYGLYQDDPEPAAPKQERLVNQHYRRWRKDGMLEIRALLDAVTGAKYEALIDPLAKPRPASTSADPNTAEPGADPRPRSEREGDALAELVDLMLRADQLPAHGGEPVTLTVTVNYDDLADQTGQALLDNGERIPADQIRQLACNAGVIPLVLGGASQPMDIGRKTRTFPAGIRRILVARDRGCAFPGCTRPPRHCDAHHIQHWANNGDTSVDNAVLLCRHHHTLIHQSEWEVKLVHGIPTFYPPPWLDPERKPRRNLIHAAA
ncbi:DUF222 domain-containing protein [Lentzea sp. NPDC051838]|uniref:HNH endonuclease signature motif containing protein n=1 Tax=Lentzea sp. NPDC051838 TaxID=3154849 RepID=UPI00343921D0